MLRSVDLHQWEESTIHGFYSLLLRECNRLLATYQFEYTRLKLFKARSGDMVVPTLPRTGWSPPLCFFQSLDYGGEYLAIFLIYLMAAIAYPYYGWFLYKFARNIVRKHCSEETSTFSRSKSTAGLRKCLRKIVTCLGKTATSLRKARTCLSKCGGCFLPFLSWVLIYGSTKLNVTLLPGLFKQHKDRHLDQCKNRRVTRVFILFLDRKMENNYALIFSFYLLALAIFSLALLVIFHYIPVDVSWECLKKDEADRDLFCYRINESSFHSWPVNCTTYNITELEEIDFVCYAISILDLGIALAAAMSLTKVATVSITIYISISEAVYKWSQGNTRQYCGMRAKRIYILYAVLTLLTLYGFSFMLPFVAIVDDPEKRQLVFAYALLPATLIPFLFTVMCNLSKHCDQEEYISYSQDQMPSHEKDCDIFVECANNPSYLTPLLQDHLSTAAETSPSKLS